MKTKDLWEIAYYLLGVFVGVLISIFTIIWWN